MVEKKMRNCLAILLLTGLLGACATNSNGTKTEIADEPSKLEVYNRAMFKFNNQLDRFVLKPTAKAYLFVTPKSVRNRMTNFFENLEEPASVINNLLQGEVKKSGISIARFAVNSTLGLLGTFDVATGWGLQKEKNTFDATMAAYCLPDGPFLVAPVFGPGTPRSFVGRVADAFTDPMYWALFDEQDETWGVALAYGGTGLKYVHWRAENMELMDGLEESSVDFYQTVKSAFLQNRTKFQSFCASKENAQELSYDFDFDEEMDEE